MHTVAHAFSQGWGVPFGAMSRKSTQRGSGKPIRPVSSPPPGWWTQFKESLAGPVNGASLAAFRIALGLVMSLEAYSLCRPNAAAISAGTTPLQTYYTGTDITFHLPYPAFGWLPLLPPDWIHVVVGVLAIAGVTMALGFWYRLSATLVFLTWGYLWVVESTRTYWQSHYYLEVLLTFLLIWMPAARRYSIDAWLARGRNLPRTVPSWTILLLRVQLVLAYFYAGVAKLSTDWLFDAAPIRWVLADPAITRPYERFLSAGQLEFFQDILQSPGLAHFICWTGFIFDLAVGFLLLARRTRLFGLVLMIIFHATNHFVIFDDIGWFPLVGVATALIFLETDWPERLGRWLRRPRLPKPDWSWFATGALVFPVVGAALGWRARAAQPPTESSDHHHLGRWTAAFVIVWLAWQTVMPLRHYWIAGDGRFTYEGMSFSWRLKGEARHALGHQLYIRDAAILPTSSVGRTSINWNEWHGDKVIYRRVTPGRMDWSQLPEVVVLLEPFSGERILYNPAAGPGPRTETGARERITQIWQQLYGRQPDAIRPCKSLAQVFDSFGSALRNAGREPEAARAVSLAAQLNQLERGALAPAEAMKTVRDVRAMLKEFQAPGRLSPVQSLLRTLEPFALEGSGLGTGSLLLIEDKALLESSDERFTRVIRKNWRNGPSTQNLRHPSDRFLNSETMVVYVGDVGITAKELLPRVCVFDSQDQPQQAPYIWWNSPKDLTVSKGLHISIQAFYLRRYSQRVAALWEKEYGRRPIVTAYTAVSLNGRPPQMLVDPDADLASVPVSWFRHNRWIRDLEMPRIPREALEKGRSVAGFSNPSP